MAAGSGILFVAARAVHQDLRAVDLIAGRHAPLCRAEDADVESQLTTSLAQQQRVAGPVSEVLNGCRKNSREGKGAGGLARDTARTNARAGDSAVTS